MKTWEKHQLFTCAFLDSEPAELWDKVSDIVRERASDSAGEFGEFSRENPPLCDILLDPPSPPCAAELVVEAEA